MQADIGKVICRIKEIENQKWVENNEVRFDSDVAKLLGISAQNLANYRAKGGMPHKRLVEYALKKNISINKLLGE